ncbi:SGNH/GDSL hydrolase family protein [Paenibacillus sp. GCM10027626]|uniref:SGNH/GDSL hydrolase family protein n=1 Tax=Paenibacillus sp. GCM10027626 TaxID=3273411 RepID=UPI003644E15B
MIPYGKLKNAISLVLIISLTMLTACSGQAANRSAENDLDKYDLLKYVQPIWDHDVIYNESVMILKDQHGDMPPLSLLYPIEEVVSVRDFSLINKYVEGKDYALDQGKLVIMKDGDIYRDLAMNYDEYYFDQYDEGRHFKLANGGGTIKTEAHHGLGGLTDYQIAVTYRHPINDSIVNKPESKAQLLSNTLQKLQSKEKVNIVLLGDSISAGWSASGYQYSNIPPFAPTYYEMVTDYLEHYFDNQFINASNYSVGGMTSQWGAEEEQIRKIKNEDPDLVIIAFGMNDGVSGMIDPLTYQSNIESIIQQVQSENPRTEFIIVSTMLPNAEVEGMLVNQFNYISVLQELEQKYVQVALADVTTVSFEILRKKAFRDVAANNVNHPNDFMHRIYAQVILKTLLEEF